MVRASRLAAAKIGQLATSPEALTGEVTGKARHFFREVCRLLPWTVQNYKLDELTSVPEIRGNINKMFKANANVTNPAVVDMLIYKGREELEMVLLQHKQRHHLMTDYVVNPARQEQLAAQPPSGRSKFLEAFYANRGY